MKKLSAKQKRIVDRNKQMSDFLWVSLMLGVFLGFFIHLLFSYFIYPELNFEMWLNMMQYCIFIAWILEIAVAILVMAIYGAYGMVVDILTKIKERKRLAKLIAQKGE